MAVCLSFQDFSQLERDYGQEEAEVIENTVGNIFAGQVLGDTAKTLSERFGRIVQLRTSNSLSNDNLTTSTNMQLDSLIPASKISNLSQGMFVGAVADNFDERIEQKLFHAEIVIDRGEARRGDGFVRSDPGNILVPRCRRRGSYGGDHPTQLYADQGGRLADHKTGTQTHRRRPCATASVGKEVGGSTSPPISVYHGLPSVLKSGNEECDFTLWTVCKSYVRVM